MGRVVAVAGQSLAVRMFREVGDDATTISSLGITVGPNGVCFGTADGFPSPGTSWVLPADHSGTLKYDSAFAAEFLNLQVAAAGVNCAQVGCPVGSTSITAWIGTGAQVSTLHGLLDAVAGWEAFIWMQGHSDSLAGMSNATYQADLGTLFADITPHNAVRGSSYDKYLASIPNNGGSWGTPSQITVIRNASSAWAAANGGTYVAPEDLNTVDGTHPNQHGALVMAQHFHRAMRPALGLTHGDAGPAISSASRASGSANVVLTMSLPTGATAMSFIGSPGGRFFVASPNSQNLKRIISSLSISGSQITLALATAPPNNEPLDVWFARPFDPTDSSADMVYDNNVDGDGITTGRHPVVSLAATTVAAPVPSHGPNLSSTGTPTWGTGQSGFGQCFTGGGTGQSSYTTGYADDVIPYGDVWTAECFFKIASAPASFAGIFTCGALNTWLTVNSAGKLFLNTSFTSLTGTTNVCDNAWHHVRLVMNGDLGMQLYLGGVLEATTSTGYAPDATATTSQFTLGGLHFGSNNFTGSLDEFAVWTIAKNTSGFTPPSAPYTGTETGLYALYHLDGNFNAG
jgi:hypothetical protein